jgi:hypothetical protein
MEMPLQNDLREFIESLNSHHVEYLIIGAFARPFAACPLRVISVFLGALGAEIKLMDHPLQFVSVGPEVSGIYIAGIAIG